ncbi:MAG: hypothetical protein COT74_11615 [Bdellovibrionales bacterium CG10_big_fil_rev_8_21_14_0_10_45_34]|nr:MAG: hypothetical protein COT74_11615 [Bdellovibrionales bacterium CG10_big_fil_rev_8_21_14_0_10_45_34]
MSQGKRTNNFFEEKAGKNDVYAFNKSHHNRQEVRDYCSKLLEHHWQYCGDSHFQQDAVENPQQRWWEMYLSWVLYKVAGFKGHKVNGEGPDFCVLLPDGKKIWIEAVAVKAGTNDNEVTRPPVGRAGTLPVDKMVLRVTSAFADKARKIERYIEQKIISPEDAVVIAINTGEMRDSDLADQYPPLAVRALLGVGAMAFKVSVHLGDTVERNEDVEVVFPEQKSIQKSQQASISTEGLLNNPSVSGVFTSTRHLVDMMDSGKDLKILLNPKARSPLDASLFKVGTIIS